MADVFTETLVKKNPVRGAVTLKSVLAVVTVVSAVAGLVFFPLWIAAIAGGIGWYYLQKNGDVEFEYAHTNGEFDVDKVMNGASRKHLVTVDLGRVDIVAPVGHEELAPYEGMKVTDYSANDPANPPYAMVCNLKEGKRILLLQLDEKMLTSLRRWMPGKVKRG